MRGAVVSVASVSPLAIAPRASVVLVATALLAAPLAPIVDDGLDGIEMASTLAASTSAERHVRK